MQRPGVALTLLTRAYCGLCETMEAEASALAQELGAPLEVIDVDAHPDLVARWDALVPVLLLGSAEGEPLCHYRLDAGRVRTLLGR